jgi:hypothetical protein
VGRDLTAALSLAERQVAFPIVRALLDLAVREMERTEEMRNVAVLCAVVESLGDAIDEHGDALIGVVGNLLVRTELGTRMLNRHDTQNNPSREVLEQLYVKLFAHKPFKYMLGREMLRLFNAETDLSDRRDHRLIDLSVQVLTVPSIAARLVVKHDYLERAFAALQDMFAPRTPAGHANSVHVNFKDMRYWRLVVDIKYVLTPFACQFMVYADERKRLALLLDVLERVQFADPNQRQLQHPRYDPFNADTLFTLHLRLAEIVECAHRGAAFGVAPAVAKALAPSSEYCNPQAISELDADATWDAVPSAQLAQQFNDSGAVGPALCAVLRQCALRAAGVTKRIGWHTTSLWRDTVDVYDCNLIDGTMTVSFHIPLHRMFAAMLWRAVSAWPLLDVSMARLLSSVADAEQRRLTALCLLEPPLQLAVLCSQVAHCRWRRNGMLPATQMHYYQSAQFRDMREDDVFLCQWAATELWRDPAAPQRPHFLAAVLHRWGVESHIELSRRVMAIGKQDAMAAEADAGDEVANDTRAALVDALRFLIAVHSDRTRIGGGSRRSALRHAMIQALAVGPLPYSAIGSCVSEHLGELECFDDVLAQVAQAESGTGSRSARYALKPACWAEFDPFYMFVAPDALETARANFAAAARNDASLVGAPRCTPVHSAFAPLVARCSRRSCTRSCSPCSTTPPSARCTSRRRRSCTTCSRCSRW